MQQLRRIVLVCWANRHQRNRLKRCHQMGYVCNPSYLDIHINYGYIECMTRTDSRDLTVQTVAGTVATLEVVQRVFELTDLRPSTRQTYQHSIRSFLAWGRGRALTPALLVEYKNHL